MIASVACVATKANHQILSIWLKRPTWVQALPAALKKKAAQNMYAGFEPIPNRKNVWQRTQTIDGSELVVIAIQTDS
jgi:hypothetical protein